ncbi:MAG: hypothetical protein EOO20_14560 [Chryseobacterium sp.]|nr:MAG: hypothetical protein EOO20_14560 [Chryseobacterium sp.]
MNNYLFEEHSHNFGVWTAARAVSRNFTSTLYIKNAIDCSGLKEFVASNKVVDQECFNNLHKVWANRIIASLNVAHAKGVSYGRAAKVIAIYLKTTVVLVQRGDSEKSRVIHPPVDRILLRALLKKFPHFTYLKNVNWTQLDEGSYWVLADKIKVDLKGFNWQLEYYWKPESEIAYQSKHF